MAPGRRAAAAASVGVARRVPFAGVTPPGRTDASAMPGDAAATERPTRSAPARPERARGGPWRSGRSHLGGSTSARRSADSQIGTSALSPMRSSGPRERERKSSRAEPGQQTLQIGRLRKSEGHTGEPRPAAASSARACSRTGPQLAVRPSLLLARSGCFGTHGSRPAFVLACASRASRLCDRLCPEVATPASGSNAHIVTAQPGEQQSPTGIADDSVGDCGSRDRPVRCRRQGPPLPMCKSQEGWFAR